MREEVKEFLEVKKIPFGKLYERRPPGLNTQQIIEAAENLYDEIQQGFKIKDISLARNIWARAKYLKGQMEEKKEQAPLREDVILIHLLKISETLNQLRKEEKRLFSLEIVIFIEILIVGIFLWAG